MKKNRSLNALTFHIKGLNQMKFDLMNEDIKVEVLKKVTKSSTQIMFNLHNEQLQGYSYYMNVENGYCDTSEKKNEYFAFLLMYCLRNLTGEEQAEFIKALLIHALKHPTIEGILELKD